jgi:hypothetical protein
MRRLYHILTPVSCHIILNNRFSPEVSGGEHNKGATQ